MNINKRNFEIAMAKVPCSISELADMSSVTRGNIYQIRRKGIATTKTVGLLAKALNVEVEYLIEKI